MPANFYIISKLIILKLVLGSHNFPLTEYALSLKSPPPGTDHNSSSGSINLLFSPVRRGSACRQLHPLPTIVASDLGNTDGGKVKKYVKKAAEQLTEAEIAHNNDLYEEIVDNEFPAEDMLDKSFRDKVEPDPHTRQLYQMFFLRFQDKELALKSWLLNVSVKKNVSR